MSGLALFSMFFGAGNLILPPLLGFKALDQWFIVAIGFAITAVIIPIMAIYAHARLQCTLYDFGKKVSPIFSFVFMTPQHIPTLYRRQPLECMFPSIGKRLFPNGLRVVG